MAHAPTRTLRALVLDLDGTLLDTAPGLTDALNQTLVETGRPMLAVAAVKPMIGDGVDVLIQRAAAATGGPFPPEQFPDVTARYRALLHETPLPKVYPGARAMLGKLNEQGVKLAVCTNKPDAAARDVLDRTGLIPFLDAVIGADAAPLKPDPTMVHRALTVMQAEPVNAAFIGDSEVDVLTGHAAGLPVVLLEHGYLRGHLSDSGADAHARSFSELPTTLKSIGLQVPLNA